MAQQPNMPQDYIQVNVVYLLTTCHILTKAQDRMLHGVLVPICISDICGKIVCSQ